MPGALGGLRSPLGAQIAAAAPAGSADDCLDVRAEPKARPPPPAPPVPPTESAADAAPGIAAPQAPPPARRSKQAHRHRAGRAARLSADQP